MPLNATVLAAAMRANLLADPTIQAIDGAPLTAMCSAIASAVVSHLTTVGVVVPTALIAPSGGGPVTGVGTLT